MGLLDDAIREHLELKRKHGAADEELRRQETEALGPARRDFAADAAVAEEPPLPSGRCGAAVPEPAAEPAAGSTTSPASAVRAAAAARAAPEPVAEPSSPWTGARAARRTSPPPSRPRPSPRRRATAAERHAHAGIRRAQPRRRAGAEGDEDVLEETPDFLQDTPEHDRLWFEQKPPRDFDFDD